MDIGKNKSTPTTPPAGNEPIERSDKVKKGSQSVSTVTTENKIPRQKPKLTGTPLKLRGIRLSTVRNSPMALFKAWVTRQPTPVQKQRITEQANHLAYSLEKNGREVSFHHGKLMAERGSTEHKLCLLLEASGLIERIPDNHGALVYKLKRPDSTDALNRNLDMSKALCRTIPVLIKPDARMDWNGILEQIAPSTANNLLMSGIIRTDSKEVRWRDTDNPNALQNFHHLQNQTRYSQDERKEKVIFRLDQLTDMAPAEDRQHLVEQVALMQNERINPQGLSWILEAANKYDTVQSQFAAELKEHHAALLEEYRHSLSRTKKPTVPKYLSWDAACRVLKKQFPLTEPITLRKAAQIAKEQDGNLPFDIHALTKYAKRQFVARALEKDFNTLHLPKSNPVALERIESRKNVQIQIPEDSWKPLEENEESDNELRQALNTEQKKYDETYERVRALYDSARSKSPSDTEPDFEAINREALLDDSDTPFLLNERYWEHAYRHYISDQSKQQ